MRRIRDRLSCAAFVATLIVWPALSYRALPGEDVPREDVPGEDVLGEDAQRTMPAGSVAAPALPPDPEPAARIREGSVLKNLAGTFKVAGDRITFCPRDQETALLVLENLALERVGGMLESVGGRLWSVSGTVTEYRGRNYLLIDRAVVRSHGAESTARP